MAATLCSSQIAGWSSLVARQAHNLKVVGSNPTPATNSLSEAYVGSAPPVDMLKLGMHDKIGPETARTESGSCEIRFGSGARFTKARFVELRGSLLLFTE